jgi:putative ABC transport system permease protein
MAGAFIWTATNNIILTVLGVIVGGVGVGIFTSVLYSFVKISKLLSGILTFTLLYSINLNFFGLPNVSISVGSGIETYLPYFADFLFFILVYYLLKTSLGTSLKTQGSNPKVHQEFGLSTPVILGIGMAISASLIAVSGFFTAISFGFADTQIGIGLLVHCVAGILIGEVFSRPLKISSPLLVVFIGMLIYTIIINAVVFYLPGLISPSDTKFVSGIIVIILLLFNKNNKIEMISI